ncbi:hypothetical protein AB0E08_08345 [Streptomyces sp. NPDC048281]|uniref:hypothetical protein n=1 Tax=Streptomyces sp. NPDC048281 TaxID=3154715 RepID=UPI00341418B4
MTASTDGPRVCPTICDCGNEPAVGIDSWTGEPVGEDCATLPHIQTTPLTDDDIVDGLSALSATGAPKDERNAAMDRLCGLLTYHQKRIADLEAAVAKLTKEASA